MTTSPSIHQVDPADPQRPLPRPASGDSSTDIGSGVPVAPTGSPRRSAGVADVRFDDAEFWGRRQSVNRAHTLAHCEQWMERLGWLENFDRVGRGEETVERAGWMFSDSEVYKLLEAMAWDLAREPDVALSASFDALVARVAFAQTDDGYIGTAFGHPGLAPRYSDLAMGHELYNIGHLLQAGVAQLRGRGEHPIVDVARRAADHVCREFGEGAREGICGHPEIEVALAEFGRATGDRRYLAQAALFIERRGRGSLPVRPLLSAEYFQDDTPVRAADVLRGHAVRALYLSAGAADVAVDTGDVELFDAVRRQWERTVQRRTYLTGGMGSRHQDEGFGEDFELPADRAYCETCAGVASVMLSWRLYLATGEVQYADLIERTLFNVIATSPSDDGRAFFYANPLHQRAAGEEAAEGVNMRAEGGTRAPWFDVSCCPTNVARTLASLPTYTAAIDDGVLVLMQYAAGDVHLGGFDLRVETHYPDDEVVRVHIDSAPEGPSTVRLRVPAWAGDATLVDPDGTRRAVTPGWVDIERAFAAGDVIALELPIAPRFTWPDARIDAMRGTVAVERGPLVLALESFDLPPGVGLDDVRIDTEAAPVAERDGALVRIEVVSAEPVVGGPPFGARPILDVAQTGDVFLVPYHRWAERGPSTMRIFLPAAEGAKATTGTSSALSSS